MSGNDQTLNDATTKPTLETVLERINAVAGSIEQLRTDMDQRFVSADQRFTSLGEEVTKLRTEMDQRFNAVDREIANLRKDVERGFRHTASKIGYLANDFLDRRSEIDELSGRVEELEKKAS